MPQFQAMVERANATFNRDTMGGVNAAFFAPGADVVASLVALNVIRTPAERAFVDALPSAVKETVRGSIHDGLTGSPPVPVQFLWMPAGHVEVRVTSVPGSASSIGGISVLLHTPIP
jgi:hypothetical protein